MKRLVIRLSILSVVAASGLIAIAQGRNRGSAGTEQAADATPTPAAKTSAADPLKSAANPTRNSLPSNFDPDLLPVPARSRTIKNPVKRPADDLPGPDEMLARRRLDQPAPRAGRYPANAAQDAEPMSPTDQEPSLEPMPQEGADEAVDPSAPTDDALADDALAAAPNVPVQLTAAPQTVPNAAPRSVVRSKSAAAAPAKTDRYGAAPAAAPRRALPAADDIAPAEVVPQGAVRLHAAIPHASTPQGETAGAGRPGGKQLEGSQAPSLTLLKSAPEEIQVGKECQFEIIVRNVGPVPAMGVEIHDEIPAGAMLISTKPEASQDGEGRLVWKLGALQPAQEIKVEVRLMPQAEGEIGSVATVHFAAQASARSKATRPALALRLTAPAQVMIGGNVRIGIEVANSGSGAARDVVLLENIPEGLKHPAGPALEFEIGTLPPGQSRQLELSLTAERAGVYANLLEVRGDGNLRAQETAEFEVIAPELAIEVQGPKRRYLERPATYTLSVNNPGTAAAKEIELTSYLPKGMKFVRANNAGYYDPQTHSVTWGLEELPAKQSGTVELVAVPIEAGEQKLRVSGKADQGLTHETQQTVEVEGLAALMFTVADSVDPVEVGGETQYEIRVVNQGSKASTNIQVAMLLPPEMKCLSADGPTRHEIEAGRVIYLPLASLAPKADATFRLKIQATHAGDQRVRVQVQSDEMRSPVTKEESTRVYADE